MIRCTSLNIYDSVKLIDFVLVYGSLCGDFIEIEIDEGKNLSDQCRSNANALHRGSNSVSTCEQRCAE